MMKIFQCVFIVFLFYALIKKKRTWLKNDLKTLIHRSFARQGIKTIRIKLNYG